MNTAKYILRIDEFVRAVGVNKTVPHALFLGAGASITSGIPSAGMCIWEWKRDIFLTNNPGLEDQFSELSLASIKERIQRWLDGKGGYPPSGSAEEYSFYIEMCFPVSDNRRHYFQEKVRSAQRHIACKRASRPSSWSKTRLVINSNAESGGGYRSPSMPKP